MHNIKNFFQITPAIGTSGQPTEEQFGKIAAAGYYAVVNLAMPNHADSVKNEDFIVTGLGMHYFHLPVPFNDPKPEHVRLFCNIMNAVYDHKIWVHCIWNYRVSAFVFHFLTKVKNLDESQSKSPMFDIWEPDETWKNFLNLTSKDIGL